MNLPGKQVERSHYIFSSYMKKERWISIWHQLDEVIKQKPKSVLEIGPGSGIFKNVAASFEISVKTLDIDPDLNPDYLGSIEKIPLHDESFDMVCAFQVLEHMPFEISKRGLIEMARVSRKSIVISLPDVTTSWASSMNIPKIGIKKFVLYRPFFLPKKHRFDGEHYWELGKEGYSVRDFLEKIKDIDSIKLSATYRVHENQYHRFFVFEKIKK